jgi:hypothetical protein
MPEPDTYAPRSAGDPLDASVLHADTLTTSLVERQARAMWELLSQQAGIPLRRWLRHHPLADGASILRRSDGGHLEFDRTAWRRFAALAPGAVALPGRVAASYWIDAATLRPPDRRARLLDLLAARRQRRRQLRRERTLDAELARWDAALDGAAELARAEPELADYARAARLEQALALPAEARAGAIAGLGRFDALARATREARDADERRDRLEAAWRRARELQLRQLAAATTQVDALVELLVADGRLHTRDSASALTVTELLAVARGAAPRSAPPRHSSR